MGGEGGKGEEWEVFKKRHTEGKAYVPNLLSLTDNGNLFYLDVCVRVNNSIIRKQAFSSEVFPVGKLEKKPQL